jgi:hypothetical protein
MHGRLGVGRGYTVNLSEGFGCCFVPTGTRCLLPQRVFSGKQTLPSRVIVNCRLLICVRKGSEVGREKWRANDPRSNTMRSLWSRAVCGWRSAELQRSGFIRARLVFASHIKRQDPRGADDPFCKRMRDRMCHRFRSPIFVVPIFRDSARVREATKLAANWDLYQY